MSAPPAKRPTGMRFGGRVYPTADYAEASAMFTAALARWPGRYADVRFPRLCADDGAEVGYVSSNGRVWLGSPLGNDAVCVYTPA
ncbi:MAG: hypothetical protein IPK81_14140 [Rhodospirillales bacterium]|nr:MAG: hypothetical protein IPK81_14140 [Rhodospirillales bacterium]